MTMCIVVGAAALMFGVYAGKKRSKGARWDEIVRDFVMDAFERAARAYGVISAPFRRKGKVIDRDC